MAFRHSVVLGLCGIALFGSWGCQKQETAHVQFSYVVQPLRGLPPGLKTVTILPASVGPTTDPRWSDMASTIITGLVNESRNEFKTPLTVVDRRDVEFARNEANLEASGGSTTQSGNPAILRGADAVIHSNINVTVDTRVGKQRTISGVDIGALLGEHTKGGHTAVETSEVDVVSRNTTIQTEFKLLDKSNQVWEHYLPKTFSASEHKGASFLFGSSATAADLPSTDQYLVPLVESAATEFVSRLMPCRINVSADIESSGSNECNVGVQFLRAQMYPDSLKAFVEALSKNPNDHRSAFGAGLAAEASGDFGEALRYYQMALRSIGLPDYRDAMDRVKAYGSRVRKG